MGLSCLAADVDCHNKESLNHSSKNFITIENQFKELAETINGKLSYPPFLEKFNFTSIQNKYASLEEERLKMLSLVEQQENGAHPELSSLLIKLKEYASELSDIRAMRVMENFEGELNKYEQVVTDQVKKLDDSIYAITLIIERSADKDWCHFLQAQNKECSYCKNALSAAAAFWCMSCEKKFCKNCQNNLSLPKHICKQQDYKAQICPPCSYSYMQNKRLYEVDYNSTKCKLMQCALEDTKIRARRDLQALLLRDKLLKETERLSMEIKEFAAEYVLACDKLLVALKARMSLLQILQNAATSKDALFPSIGILAGKTLEHLSKYGVVPMEALGNALPFLGIAAINVYVAHQEAGKISKYIFVGSCQTLAYAGTRKSHAIIAMVTCWAASMLAQIGYEMFFEKDQWAIRGLSELSLQRDCIIF